MAAMQNAAPVMDAAFVRFGWLATTVGLRCKMEGSGRKVRRKFVDEVVWG